MKDLTRAAIQYSGYPLSIAEPKTKTEKKTGLYVIKPEVYRITTFIQKNRITNDPHNWDVDWFSGYE